MSNPSPEHARNLLANETSPYLLQHQNNPVHWQPWGEAAFKQAREQDKPVFLSVGYAACHWCHVMEHESFENETVAGVLNEHFISIKVDREERPDIDAIYMSAVQMLTGAGGWPMSVFLTPDGKPFYGGTYFPPEDRWGRPGFITVLSSIAEAWQQEKSKILHNGKALMRAIDQLVEMDATSPDGPKPSFMLTERAVARLMGQYDETWGGFGGAPKFPPSMALELLMREGRRRGADELLEAATKTLDMMARGGLYDQLGGGFHRYSVDAQWLVPHFEKMLYDNALLSLAYFDAWRETGDERWLRVGKETLDYLLRDMVTEGGGFASAEDADSEGVEGKFYIWTPEQVREVLGDDTETQLICDFFDIRDGGNWHEGGGASILNVPTPLADFAERIGADANQLQTRIDSARNKLLEARSGRDHPLKDDKVLTAWNGLVISAMAQGTQVSGDDCYVSAARRAADFILSEMRDHDGTLLRTWRQGQAKVPAFLEDYAALIVGLVDLYETQFDPSLLDEAITLAEQLLERFDDAEGIGFFTTDGQDETVVARLKDFYDGASPSGNSLAVHALWRLGRLVGREDFLTAAREIVDQMSEEIAERSPAYHHLAVAMYDMLAEGPEVVIVGRPSEEPCKAMIVAAWQAWAPGRMIVAAASSDEAGSASEWLEGRESSSESLAYVCRAGRCERPESTVEGLTARL